MSATWRRDEDIACARCFGLGKEGNAPCRTCIGTGVVPTTCPMCKGEGKWWERYGPDAADFDVVHCDGCDGSGKNV